ncbi:TatD DNase family protein [Parabacteroides sp. PF5-5]|uniref:TatD family hydrolase n=1 Tax=unclassified Parabacteroides TaxID=2649774 RepID=UPI0024746F0B|nr:MULTISPECIES: TatD family hydrolase [unclassified Parabacteroides]MDH6303473.1 TatD DNase family protein [Parabacteroides sp. PH5-39]MDH6314795.1 TatD DNase family protein [Parabacteroides sp. PF5-13]MDH6318132.1 TatD DNase family protein [Parabacteroides sp. PH5-13]MDH6321936.1 TatD DNase family protein [Parabacteroides sp. PH5-8]MDH6326060.1 TatD DNase family protein [Parabacteroides sp. PH5-41]
MKLIDTHCHLYLEEFDADREEMVLASQTSGIDTILLPNVDATTIERMHALCERHPNFAYPMMGLHPTSVKQNYVAELKKIESQLNTRSYCAIGEIGIDLYWDKTYLAEQKLVFEEQLRWSIDKDLPVAIHTRDAFPEVFDSIHKVGKDKLRGVFHSFSGTEADLAEVKRLQGFKLGINGVVTFKNSGLAEVLKHATIDDIVLETDAPYLAPVPYRGKRNDPVYIWKTAEKLASVFQLTLEETVFRTRKNALKLFKIVNKAI